jgi:hypothetical protein
MLRNILLLVILSILVILFMHPFSQFLGMIDHLHNLLAIKLALILSTNSTGIWIRNVLALILIPMGVGLIPAALYALLRRSPMPYLTEIMWFTWLLLATTLALHH